MSSPPPIRRTRTPKAGREQGPLSPLAPQLPSIPLARALAHGVNSLPAGAVGTAVGDVQRLAGNAAAQQFVGARALGGAGQRILQRAPLTAADKAKNLTSARYGGDPDLEKAYDNSPALRRGDRGDGVAKVQQGLVDDGFDMPLSTKSGSPDGIFERETRATVKEFQDKYGLAEDGAVGRETMGKLDELAGGEGPKPKPPEPTPEIAATEEEMGKRVVEGMRRANTDHSPTSGVWYDYNYFAEHKKDPANYPWKDEWRRGFASPEYFEHLGGYMEWRLKPGKSASEGIKAWLKGLTITECLTAIVAIEIDTLRAAIGDAAFDERYGSAEKPVPEASRLRVRQSSAGTPIEGKLKAGEAAADPGKFGKRPLKVGDWVYFYNHPKYLLKHPGGAWQGENAVYLGDNAAGQQLFSGMGADEKTEEGMLQEMVGAYKAERDGDDYVRLLDRFAKDAPEVKRSNRQYLDHDTAYTRSLYEKYKKKIPAKYHEDSGEFKDEVTAEEILKDPPYELDGATRKGGFLERVTGRLDPAKVAPLRPAP